VTFGFLKNVSIVASNRPSPWLSIVDIFSWQLTFINQLLHFMFLFCHD